ncbi:MAG: nitrile hydratase subunit beta [Pseudomonadota bacterium]
MSRIHDMGGRIGDGPVDPGTPDDPHFYEDWQVRAHAVSMLSMPLGQFNIDQRRHARECLSPADYMRFTYYEKWLAGVADMLVEKGILSRGELAGDAPDTPSDDVMDRVVTLTKFRESPKDGTPYDRTSEQPRLFAPGDRVLTRRQPENIYHPGGHTRLPGYAAAAVGTVLRCHGAHVLPDSNAHDFGEAPEPLYAVAFDATTLWTAPEHPRDQVVVDLWQSYLGPA